MVRCPAVGIELGEPAAVEVLLIRVRAGECEVDVVEDADLGRAGSAGGGRPDAFGECGDRYGVLVVEERAVAVDARHGVRGGAGSRVRVAGLRLRLRHDAGRGAERRTDQERATGIVVLAIARVVLLAHADSSLGIF